MKTLAYFLSALVLTASYPAMAETTKCKAITRLPYVIEVAGVYCLKKNLAFEANGIANVTGAAITVASTAAGAVLDLNGFTLSGGSAVPTNSFTDGISVEANQVTVKNGIIKNFYNGVNCSSYRSGLIVEDLSVDSSLSTGILLWAQKSVVRRNLITNTGGYTGTANATAFGIYAWGDDLEVANNTILGVAATGTADGVGIVTRNTVSDRVFVHHNQISTVSSVSGADAGIWFRSGTGHIASDNRITNPGAIGIDFDGSGVYMNNLVLGATSSAYSGGTAAGSTNY